MPQARYTTGPLCHMPAEKGYVSLCHRPAMPQARYANGSLCHGSAECVNARLLVPQPRLEGLLKWGASVCPSVRPCERPSVRRRVHTHTCIADLWHKGPVV